MLEQIKELQESVDKLTAKNREIVLEKQKAADLAKQAEAEKQAEAARKAGDLEALEKSWAEKYESALGERDTALSKYRSQIESMTVGSTAQKLAADLALPGSAEVLLPHIQRRLTAHETENGLEVRVLDAQGNLSSMSVDELRSEIENSTMFAPILAGSKASGVGHQPGSVSGKKTFGDYSPQELMEIRRENPTEYERIRNTR